MSSVWIGVDTYIESRETAYEETYGPADPRTFIGTSTTERVCLECGTSIEEPDPLAILCVACAASRGVCMDCGAPVEKSKGGRRYCPYHRKLSDDRRKTRYLQTDKGREVRAKYDARRREKEKLERAS